MRNLVMMGLSVALAAAIHQVAAAEPCAADNKARVAANDECLVIKTYVESAERTSLIIFIHGDGYRREPSDYGPSDYMYRIAQKFGAKGVVAVKVLKAHYNAEYVILAGHAGGSATGFEPLLPTFAVRSRR